MVAIVVVPGLVAVLVLLVLAMALSVARESLVDWLPVHPRTSSSRFPFPRAHTQGSVDRHGGTVSVPYMRSSCPVYPPPALETMELRLRATPLSVQWRVHNPSDVFLCYLLSSTSPTYVPL